MTTTSLYIHWPFCKSKCPYCDFNSHVRDEPIESASWSKAYLDELEYYKDFLKDKTITSIYFGGGTPSLMPPSLVEKLIEKASQLATLTPNIEITLEGNPTSIEIDKLRDFKQAGVNRVSLGIQALDNQSLKFLGREHSASEALNALEVAASLFERYTFDLIYARPEQTLSEWQKELGGAMQFMQSHASLYQLTIEKGTPFYGQYQKGDFKMPDDTLSADMYELTNEMMEEKGLIAYEVSNYAKPGHESQHNLNYWRYGDYIGIGAGAHGRLSSDKGKLATTTIHHPENWLKQVQDKGSGIQQRTKLTHQEMLEEILMFGLRLKEGIELKRVEVILHHPLLSLISKENLKMLKEKKFLVINNSHLSLTTKGRILVNSAIDLLIGY